MDLTVIVALGGSALVYLVAAAAVATTPMGNVRRAAARGRPEAQREYANYLGWLITLFFGGPIVIVALWTVALTWPELWRAGEGLAWAMLFGLPASAPGALLAGMRLVVELSRAGGAPVAPRCPLPWSSPHRAA
jgi:hypothetical protein